MHSLEALTGTLHPHTFMQLPLHIHAVQSANHVAAAEYINHTDTG